MSLLENPRHERFAQELAKGRTQAQAYAEAGYQESRSAASRLAADPDVRLRVAQIAGQAAMRTEVTIASLTRRLLAIADKGEAAEEAAKLAVARAAIMDAAKLNGLVIDKAEGAARVAVYSDNPMSAEEWASQHAPPTRP